MATKPIVQPELWASNAVYTTGPFIGSPGKVVPGGPVAAEGHRPGSAFPTPAEYENSQQNRITDLVRWVFLGSSAGAADAHIVETDAAGRATLHGLTVDDSADETALAILAASSVQAGVTVLNTAGGPALTADIGNAFTSCVTASVGTGNGAAFDAFMFGTIVGGAGLRVAATGATAGTGVIVNHAGSGTGIAVTASGTGVGMTVAGGASQTAVGITGGAAQAALQATSGLDAPAAVAGLGVGTAIGLTGQGGSGSIIASGVEGTAVHADARGVYGRTSVSASSVAAGVRGDGLGAGTSGVHAVSIVGRGLLVQGDTSSPAYPAMRIIPQDADPSAGVFDGELYWNDAHKQLRTCVAGYGYRSMPTFGPGSAMSINAEQEVSATASTGAAFGAALLSVTCDTATGTGYYGEADNAELLIEFTGDIRLGVGVADYFEVRITDVTNGDIIAEWSGSGNGATAGFYQDATGLQWGRSISVACRHKPDFDGDVQIDVYIAHVSSTQLIRNAKLKVTGTFNQ